MPDYCEGRVSVERNLVSDTFVLTVDGSKVELTRAMLEAVTPELLVYLGVPRLAAPWREPEHVYTPEEVAEKSEMLRQAYKQTAEPFPMLDILSKHKNFAPAKVYGERMVIPLAHRPAWWRVAWYKFGRWLKSPTKPTNSPT